MTIGSEQETQILVESSLHTFHEWMLQDYIKAFGKIPDTLLRDYGIEPATLGNPEEKLITLHRDQYLGMSEWIHHLIMPQKYPVLPILVGSHWGSYIPHAYLSKATLHLADAMWHRVPWLKEACPSNGTLRLWLVWEYSRFARGVAESGLGTFLGIPDLTREPVIKGKDELYQGLKEHLEGMKAFAGKLVPVNGSKLHVTEVANHLMGMARQFANKDELFRSLYLLPYCQALENYNLSVRQNPDIQIISVLPDGSIHESTKGMRKPNIDTCIEKPRRDKRMRHY